MNYPQITQMTQIHARPQPWKPEALRPRTPDSRQAFLRAGAERKPRLCPAKYPEKFDGKYRQMCLQPCARLRRDVCTDLNPELYLDLNSHLNPRLHRALLA